MKIWRRNLTVWLPDPIIRAVGGVMVNFAVYLRALRLPFLTGSLFPVAVATAQALTIQTHFFTGLSLTLALLYAAWWR